MITPVTSEYDPLLDGDTFEDGAIIAVPANSISKLDWRENILRELRKRFPHVPFTVEAYEDDSSFIIQLETGKRLQFTFPNKPQTSETEIEHEGVNFDSSCVDYNLDDARRFIAYRAALLELFNFSTTSYDQFIGIIDKFIASVPEHPRDSFLPEGARDNLVPLFQQLHAVMGAMEVASHALHYDSMAREVEYRQYQTAIENAALTGSINGVDPNDVVEFLREMPYQQYLTTPHWQQVRQETHERAGKRCQVCNTNNETLHVHHRTYDNRGCENPEDVIVLCATCHKLFHDNGRLAK